MYTMYIVIAILVITSVAFFGFNAKIIKQKIVSLAKKIYTRRRLQKDKDYQNFNQFFETIQKDLIDLCPEVITPVRKRIHEVVSYSVPDGKKFRGLLAVKFYNNFKKNKELNEEKMNGCNALGWFVEVQQAAFLIYDDIMDEAITRRGKPCWYKYRNNGILAFNDVTVLRLSSPILLKKYCSQFEHYLEILDLWFTISQATMLGQILDCMTTPQGKQPDFTLLTDTRYETVVKYKTSLYTFVLPIRMAMYLANIADQNIHQFIEQILLRIGHLFQAQDDILDVFGDPKITGKIGTDIEDGKCSWIAVKAYQRMDCEQKRCFEQSYGRKDPISTRIVRNIFKKLEMQKQFAEFEENEYKEISEMITDFEVLFNMKCKVLNSALNLIYKRVK